MFDKSDRSSNKPKVYDLKRLNASPNQKRKQVSSVSSAKNKKIKNINVSNSPLSPRYQTQRFLKVASPSLYTDRNIGLLSSMTKQKDEALLML